MFRARIKTAMQNVVGNMITAMSQVEWAEVVYSRNDASGGIGRAWIPTVATVTVKPVGKSVSQQTVDAIARLVAGTDGRLKVEDVAIIDATSGKAHSVRSDDAMSATIHLDYQRQVEAVVKTKLEATLGYIPGIRVSVNAIVDVRTQQESVRRYEDAKVGPLSERTASYESSGGRGVQEPGVRANVPRSVSIAAAGGAMMTQRNSDIATASRFPESVSEINDPGGRAVQINAAIGIPRGWFLDVYADEVSEGTFDQIVFDEMVANQIDSIEGLVQPLVNTSATRGGQAGQVEVRMINDIVAAAWGPSEPVTGSFASGLVQGETLQTVGVGLLAIVSLAMMFLMLKRAGSRTAVPNPEDFTTFDAIDDGAPDAPDSPAVLPGIEIDTVAAHHQAMVTQVQSAIDQDPQEAASLIRRWIRQGA
jgi:flagellar biosynthesis/type III secretory pathway M-ring protein FliF/YscJ